MLVIIHSDDVRGFETGTDSLDLVLKNALKQPFSFASNLLGCGLRPNQK